MTRKLYLAIGGKKVRSNGALSDIVFSKQYFSFQIYRLFPPHHQKCSLNREKRYVHHKERRDYFFSSPRLQMGLSLSPPPLSLSLIFQKRIKNQGRNRTGFGCLLHWRRLSQTIEKSAARVPNLFFPPTAFRWNWGRSHFTIVSHGKFHGLHRACRMDIERCTESASVVHPEFQGP